MYDSTQAPRPAGSCTLRPGTRRLSRAFNDETVTNYQVNISADISVLADLMADISRY